LAEVVAPARQPYRLCEDKKIKMTWNEIKTQPDADALMKRFGRFHDSCIREVHISTGYWVSPELSMAAPEDLDTRVRLHIQRQWRDPAAIELLFEEVVRFNLVPAPQNYVSIIYDATLLVREGIIHWSPETNWDPERPDANSETWISAKQLKWREVDNWLVLRHGVRS
jgi:hypothetical protein